MFYWNLIKAKQKEKANSHGEIMARGRVTTSRHYPKTIGSKLQRCNYTQKPEGRDRVPGARWRQDPRQGDGDDTASSKGDVRCRWLHSPEGTSFVAALEAWARQRTFPHSRHFSLQTWWPKWCSHSAGMEDSWLQGPISIRDVLSGTVELSRREKRIPAGACYGIVADNENRQTQHANSPRDQVWRKRGPKEWTFFG